MLEHPFVAIIACLSALSALFSGIETALFSLRPFQIRRLNEKNPALARGVEQLMENPRRLLSAILFVDALTNLPLIILSIYFIRTLQPARVPFWAMALWIFALIVLVGDLTPKMIALRKPYLFAKLGVIIFGTLMPVIDPVLRHLQAWSEKAAGMFAPSGFQQQHSLSLEELETLVLMSTEEGALLESEGRMILEVIKLSDRLVKDCMTPRIDGFMIPDDLSNDDAIALLKKRRYRRVPVYVENPDNILGILDVKTFLADPGKPYTEVLIPPSFVPETMKAMDLLRSFLTHRQGMAVIVDEFGGIEGIITMADLTDEIIGGLEPTENHKASAEILAEGKILINGVTRLDDLGKFGFHLKEDGVDTVGGLIFNRLGYLPKSGASLKIGDVNLTVRSVSRKRIEEVLLVRDTGAVLKEEGK